MSVRYVVGLGGLGHMAVKIAKAYDCTVIGQVKYRFVIDARTL